MTTTKTPDPYFMLGPLHREDLERLAVEFGGLLADLISSDCFDSS